MRKILVGVLSLFIVVGLSACSFAEKNANEQSNPETTIEPEVRATVVNNSGVTEYLTAEDLKSLYRGNSLAFEKDYWCAKVTVTGAVTEVSGPQIINGSDYDWTIVVDGDWFVGKTKYNESNITKDYLAELRVGDIVTISGEIVGAFFDVDISNGTVTVKKN